MSKRRPQPEDALTAELFGITDALDFRREEHVVLVARFDGLYREYGSPGCFDSLPPSVAEHLLSVAWRIAMRSGKPEEARDLARRFFSHPRAAEANLDDADWMRFCRATASYRLGEDDEALEVMRPVLERSKLPYQRGALYMARAFLMEYTHFHVENPDRVVSEECASFAEEVYRRIKRSKSTRRRLPELATVRDIYELMGSSYPADRQRGDAS